MTQQGHLSKANTQVHRYSDNTVVVRFHNTDVVTVYPDGKIILDSGDWFTPTTKTRMNQASNQFALGYRVFQKDFGWFVSWNGTTLAFKGRSITIER